MKGYILLIAVVLGLGLTYSLQTKNAEGYLPTKLKVSLIAFRGNITSMVWDGNVLQFEKWVAGTMTRKENITPSKEKWERFWKEMDAIEIWKWNSEYIDESLADGRSWEVLLEYGDKKIHSTGRNMYPAQFERYEKALLALQE